jgi:hypothetical protein
VPIEVMICHRRDGVRFHDDDRGVVTDGVGNALDPGLVGGGVRCAAVRETAAGVALGEVIKHEHRGGSLGGGLGGHLPSDLCIVGRTGQPTGHRLAADFLEQLSLVVVAPGMQRQQGWPAGSE